MNLKNIIIIIIFFYTYSEKNYKYYSYDEINTIFTQLSKNCSQYIKIDTSQNRYNLPSIEGCSSNCTNLIVYMTDFDSYTFSRPQYYISGLVHGDEEIGPTTITEFALYFCSNLDKKNSLQHSLLKNKLIIFTPTTNAYGYYNHKREDKIFNRNENKYQTKDPNRDFPYHKKNKEIINECFLTLAGRTINEIFNEHLILGSLTFHGGDSVIGYAWGNFLHIKNNKSTEPPDYNAFKEIGEVMYNSTLSKENNEKNIRNYSLGDMTSLVYAIDGGLEDWAYGGSWENDLNKDDKNYEMSPIKKCESYSFNEYNENWEFNINKKEKLKCLMYLIEADINKKPHENLLGINNFTKDYDVFDFYKEINFFGHVPRNLRLMFSAIDLISANIYINSKKISFNKDNTEMTIPFLFMGCKTLEKFSVNKFHFSVLKKETLIDEILLQRSFSEISIYNNMSFSNISCYWNNINNLEKIPEFNITIPGSSNNFKDFNFDFKKGNIYFIKGEGPDKNWEKQNEPDPNIKPISHVVNSKINENYSIEYGNYSLKSNYYLLSHPIINFENNFTAIIDDIDNLFYTIPNSEIKLIFSELSYFPNNYYLKSHVDIKGNFNNNTLLTSEIEYKFNLLILLTQNNFEEANQYLIQIINLNKIANNVIGKLAFNYLEHNLQYYQFECDLYKGNNNELIIYCKNFLEKIFNKKKIDGYFIRNELINSFISFEYSKQNSNKNLFGLIGMFSLDNLLKGKFFDDYYSKMICSSHLFEEHNKEGFNLYENEYKINIKRISNNKLEVSFKSIVRNFIYFIYFPFFDKLLQFNYMNVSELKQFVELDKEINGKIIGKTIYVLKIINPSNLNFISSILKFKKNLDELLFEISSFFKDEIYLSKCSIINEEIYNNIENKKIFEKIFSVNKIPLNYNKKFNYDLLIQYCLYIFGGLALCVIIWRVSKKLYNKYKSIGYNEIKVIQSVDLR